MKTTTRNDTLLANAVLDLCRESQKVNDLSLPLLLKPFGRLLDDSPIESDPTAFEEKIRKRNFTRYCQALVVFLEKMKFVYYEPDIIDNGIYPQEIHYLRPTRLGALYSRLPFWMQHSLFFVLESAYWAAELVRRYKWVGTTVSITVAFIGWLKEKDISAYLVAISAIVGVIAVLLANWLHGAGDAEGNAPSDDTLV